MNMIVYVAVALFILVLIIAFATGGIGKGFKGLTTTGPGELDTLKSKCTASCNQAKASVISSGTSAWPVSSYCTEIYGLDEDGDGTVSSEEFFSCWEAPIRVDCRTTISTAAGPRTLAAADDEANIICQVALQATGGPVN